MISCFSGFGLDFDAGTGKLYAGLGTGDPGCSYCFWGRAIYGMNPDGSQLEELFRDEFTWILHMRVNPVEGKIYYNRLIIDTATIERINLDGSGRESPPYFETWGFDIDPANQWIYGGRYDYVNFSSTLVRFATDGSQYQELSDPSLPWIRHLVLAIGGPFQQIPSLTEVGLGLLILALLAAGLWVMRARQRYSYRS